MTYLQTRARINELLDIYMTPTILDERLRDVSVQLVNPRPRPWHPICWKSIHPEQIVNMNPQLFVRLIALAAEIEDPIRQYSQESRGYLQPVHPAMARFMGGRCTAESGVLELGVWEKEERQHGPTFHKIYQQLTGTRLQAHPNTVSKYQRTPDAWQDAQAHILSRVTSEWSATAIYLWLAAHSTGELHRAIVEPLQDEVNHLAKFWGFSRWAFGGTYLDQVKATTENLLSLLYHHQGERTHGSDLLQPTSVVASTRMITELSFTLTRILVRLYKWDKQLQRHALQELFATSQAA